MGGGGEFNVSNFTGSINRAVIEKLLEIRIPKTSLRLFLPLISLANGYGNRGLEEYLFA